MGRKKIQISRISDERNRQVTFTKRKFGLMKKAYELSVLCDCEIALIIFNGNNKLFQYASTDMDKVLLKYTEYNEPHESRTNKDIIEHLNKKEHKGCDSPEPIDTDPYVHGMRTDDKYDRINDEYQRVMQHSQLNQMRGGMPHFQNPGMPGGLGLPNSGYPPPQMNLMSPHQQNHIMSGSPGLLHPPSAPPSVSPRPNSTGGMVDMSHSPTPNGYHHRVSPCSSPGIMAHKGLNKPSPAPTPPSMRPSPNPNQNIRVMIPNNNNRNDVLQQDGHGRSMNSSLAPPVVSMAPSSVGMSNYPPSALPSSYLQNNFPMSTAADAGNYHHWSGSQGMMSGPGHPGGLSPHSGSISHGISSGNVSPMALNTMSAMNIKSEPISPPRETTTPSSHHMLRPPSSGPGHLSPGHISHSHSNSSSPVNIHNHIQDYDGPLMKRSRIKAWTT
ncbi:myocyte-specific enhancer factor 2A [Patella vulgata]|uniref:myocyte-specific enhancer factor 2A n=1 Tax=Patella vulgata TaxID=6465 RepID=UPI0021802D5A|nr:myocyte-specific enhancer factor 2A [Patella vulgata]XP_050403683.1 myocyte-specific enhancer factor 2A [Patella vulgata]XP_050403684.1 myocyte-specific enhancer factor 2A [Patella vulgata]XP_050403685.1 myocyte-specific enhancer factor 2A [Patella vulgata]XP_050403686.1 myocyte-specific enhancer factor 2A [Patella vulgata]XP_050403687.1 myocyte-specific enhancer factor 2A [Patella vulgata]XP_050403688.1 myocyte-specific enhancer factor 2A [Patella vulgata]XP_055956271.1 myocyte-specific 